MGNSYIPDYNELNELLLNTYSSMHAGEFALKGSDTAWLDGETNYEGLTEEQERYLRAYGTDDYAFTIIPEGQLSGEVVNYKRKVRLAFRLQLSSIKSVGELAVRTVYLTGKKENEVSLIQAQEAYYFGEKKIKYFSELKVGDRISHPSFEKHTKEAVIIGRNGQELKLFAVDSVKKDGKAYDIAYDINGKWKPARRATVMGDAYLLGVMRDLDDQIESWPLRRAQMEREAKDKSTLELLQKLKNKSQVVILPTITQTQAIVIGRPFIPTPQEIYDELSKKLSYGATLALASEKGCWLAGKGKISGSAPILNEEGCRRDHNVTFYRCVRLAFKMDISSPEFKTGLRARRLSGADIKFGKASYADINITPSQIEIGDRISLPCFANMTREAVVYNKAGNVLSLFCVDCIKNEKGKPYTVKYEESGRQKEIAEASIMRDKTVLGAIDELGKITKQGMNNIIKR
ncbi:hypothetical protein [Treponema sp. R6D11]